MSSKSRFTSNVPGVAEADKPKPAPTSVQFESRADLRAVELAAVLSDTSRNGFITAAAVRDARRICAERGVDPDRLVA